MQRITNKALAPMVFLLVLAVVLVDVDAGRTEDMSAISEECIRTLNSKRIYFGHASVGFDIMSGLEALIQDEPILKSLNVKEVEESKVPKTPGVYHGRNPKNKFPKTKCDNFLSTLKEDDLGQELDIAFFKFCFVDVEEDTDIREVFEYYVNTVKAIEQTFPQLELIHVTVPLYVHSWGLKGYIKRLLKPDLSNVKRNQFNDLLRDKYKNTEPFFDLAQAQSTLPDGTKTSFRYKDRSYSALAKEYTYDGGHLNEVGKKQVARQLLNTLCSAVKSN
jgi:hypothetical protein